MTYAELETLVKDYLECDETTFDTHFPQFVKNAEESIYRQVQLPDLMKTETSAFVASTTTITLPSDFLSAYSLAAINSGTYTFVLSKDMSFIREAYPTTSTTGVPRYFAIKDDTTVIVAPTPASNYSYELNYFYKPDSLADGAAGGTTWLSENAEDALLFGTILQGYIFLKGDQDVIAQYKEQFETALGALKLIAEGRNRKDAYRVSDQRVPV